MTESRGDLQSPLDEGRPPDITAGYRPPAPAPAPDDTEPAPDASQPAPEVTDPAPGAADPAQPVPLRPAAPVVGPESDQPTTAPPTADQSAADQPTDDQPAAARPLLALVARQAERAARRTVRLVSRALRRTAVAVPTTAGAVMAWTRRPAGRFLLPGLLISGLLTGAVSTGALVVPAAWQAAPSPPPTPPTSGTASPTAAPGLVPPVGIPPTVPSRRGNPADPLAGWAEEMAARTGIPETALQAYGYAEVVATDAHPGCNLRWTTLAGIGRVESNHGSAGGATLLADGRALPPIVGDPLDGEADRMLIPDSDNGELDGDRDFDRAVGPMQFIPTTWRLEAVDATGDGIADINNIFDAALAAANYLCGPDRDLSDATDWWEAILSYNNVASYANAVHGAANEYGLRSHND